ncbi:MAG: alpha-2-macroglobulin family protein [Pseudomonadota bacterium]
MNSPYRLAPWLVLLSLAGLSCGAREASAPAQYTARDEEAAEEPGWGGMADAAPAPVMAEAATMPKAAPQRARDKREAMDRGLMDASELDEDAPAGPGGSKGGEGEETPTRAWFPESFLFEPLLVTNEQGTASLDVRVPDQLTDWRVLALAHSRDGSQAGTESRFASTLPVYLDVAEPPVLRVGDRALLPVQVVSNRAEGFSGALGVRVEGLGARGAASAGVAITGQGSEIRYVEVRAEKPGAATLTAELPGTDRVERALTVVPTGRRLDRAQGGTLAMAREFDLLAPYGALPGASTIALMVYPGPLGILAQELGRTGGGGAWDAAYAYALAGYGRDLSARLGQELDPSDLRKARLQAYQRLARLLRSPDVPTAIVGLAAARTQPDDPLAQALTQRLLETIASSQSPDGSFAAGWRGGTASLPRALTTTALAAHWSADLSPRIGQRAAGFSARNAGYVKDSYTAAVLLAAGQVTGPQLERLQGLVVEAAQTQPDGTRLVLPDAASQRIDGLAPSAVEVTAWSILALAGVEGQEPLVSDLAAGLLGAYRAGYGWGDGLADLAALEALARVFDAPLPESVQIRLSVDGQQVVAQTMTLAGSFDPLLARAPAPAAPGPHHYRLEAEPPIPGLAFNLTQTAWLPWSGDPGAEGFSLKVVAAGPIAVGETLRCRLQAAVPGAEPFTVTLELPAGVEVEARALDQLVAQGVLTGHDTQRGHLTLQGPALASGAVFDATVELVPTIAGALQWGGADLALARNPAQHVQAPVGRLDVAMR